MLSVTCINDFRNVSLALRSRLLVFKASRYVDVSIEMHNGIRQTSLVLQMTTRHWTWKHEQNSPSTMLCHTQKVNPIPANALNFNQMSQRARFL